MDHLKYALELGDGPRQAGFDDITLVHNCLPGLAWDAVSLATTVAGLLPIPSLLMPLQAAPMM